MKPPQFHAASFSKWLNNAIIVLLLGGLAVPVLAVNPDPAYPPGKSEGEEQEESDEEEEPSDEEGDCDGSRSQSDPSSGPGDTGGGTCGDCPPDEEESNDDSPGCIKEQVTLALAPNEPGLGAGLLRLYIDATGANLGSRKYLEFFGVTEMAVTEATAQGSATNYSIVQAGSTVMPFSIQSASGSVGKPMGATAFSQARLSFVSSGGTVTDKSGASSVRHYRSSSGAIDYPVAGGRATRFETKQGRAYTFPLAGVEVIREKTDGTLVVNGNYGSGLIRQVKTVAGLLDVVVLSPRSYEVRKYAPAAIGTKIDGIYQITGDPHFTMKVEAPGNVQNALVVTKTEGSRQTVNTYAITFSGGAETWTQTVTSGGFTYDRILKREPLAGLGPDFRRTSRSSLLNAVPAGFGGASTSAKYSLVSDNYKYMPSSSKQTFSTGKVSERAINYEKPDWDINGVGRPKARTNSLGGKSEGDPNPGRLPPPHHHHHFGFCRCRNLFFLRKKSRRFLRRDQGTHNIRHWYLRRHRKYQRRKEMVWQRSEPWTHTADPGEGRHPHPLRIHSQAEQRPRSRHLPNAFDFRDFRQPDQRSLHTHHRAP